MSAETVSITLQTLLTLTLPTLRDIFQLNIIVKITSELIVHSTRIGWRSVGDSSTVQRSVVDKTWFVLIGGQLPVVD